MTFCQNWPNDLEKALQLTNSAKVVDTFQNWIYSANAFDSEDTQIVQYWLQTIDKRLEAEIFDNYCWPEKDKAIFELISEF